VSVEDRVRTATEATAATVGQIRPLVLPDEASAARPGRLRFRRVSRMGGGWLVPAAAAAAVIVLAVTLVSVRTLTTAGHAPVTAAQSADRVPEYYAAITKSALTAPDDVTIAKTATGTALFRVKPPAGDTFAVVSAAGDDRTFVVAVAPFSGPSFPWTTVVWDLVRVRPDASGYTLTRLRVPAQPADTVIDGLAVSPDGTKLAVLSQQASTVTGTEPGPVTLRVYSVATGQLLRSWQTRAGQIEYTTTPGQDDQNSTISWQADGQGLAFDWQATTQTKITKTGAATGENGPLEVRRLDLAKPGTDLLADSTPVVSIQGWVNGICSALQPTADGNGAVCGTEYQVALAQGATTCSDTPEPLSFHAYSGLAGRYRVLYTVPPAKAVKGKCGNGTADVLWASPSGSTVVGVISTQYIPGSKISSAVGVVSNGRWTPLPASVLLPGHVFSATGFAF